MAGIVCAIRGGPLSKSTIQKSIQLANESGETIYFLYVVNLDFLTHSSSSRIEPISREMREMGEFILLDAQEKAQKQGVDAQGVIRDGSIIEEIITFCAEIQPEYIVLGLPETESENNLLTQERLDDVLSRIKEVTDAEVVISSS
ncbi:MAG: universal stress protein [Anaerolineales bacterium]